MGSRSSLSVILTEKIERYGGCIIKAYKLSFIFLAVLLVACGPQSSINPVGTWSGTTQSASGSGPVTLVVTEPTRGMYEGTFTDLLSGATFFGLGCNVTGTGMRCSADYPEQDSSFAMEGPVSARNYTGDVNAVLGVNTIAATFDLSRAAQPYSGLQKG